MSGPRPRRAVLWWAVGLGVCLMSGCAGDSSPAPAGARPVDELPETASSLSRLSSALAHMPAPAERSRNPFRFAGGSARHGGLPEWEGGDASDLPEVPLPLPRPEIRVLGIASDPGPSGAGPRRTAILQVGGELVLAPAGTLLAGRYRLTRIGERDVELVDEVDRGVQRLPLP